ncbi:MAG: hypothetical protein CSA23_02255 [Deltaproteobacteria bacterium]|nr:MAG: hypothetical protein CSA23_02255 [Deltaproteobacteria bacterium]
MTRVELRIRKTGLMPFYSLLEIGVGLQANTGCTLRVFLCGQLGLSEEYLENRIQTLLLDYRPVDDVDTARIRNGATLALSAAMPGLVGATMRKGGRYAAFRQSISQGVETDDRRRSQGRVTLKVFNLIAQEIGQGLLASGVEVRGSDLAWAVGRSLESSADTIVGARLDGQSVSPDMAFFSSLSAKPVWLSLLAAD